MVCDGGVQNGLNLCDVIYEWPLSSAPGYFQEIMDQLTGDLRGVACYTDNTLVSGSTTTEHLQNLRALLQGLQDKGLCCQQEVSICPTFY